MALHGAYKYPGNVAVDMTAILEEGATATIICGTPASGRKRCESAGFKARAVYGDVAGKAYGEESDTVAILAERPHNHQ